MGSEPLCQANVDLPPLIFKTGIKWRYLITRPA